MKLSKDTAQQLIHSIHCCCYVDILKTKLDEDFKHFILWIAIPYS